MVLLLNLFEKFWIKLICVLMCCKNARQVYFFCQKSKITMSIIWNFMSRRFLQQIELYISTRRQCHKRNLVLKKTTLFLDNLKVTVLTFIETIALLSSKSAVSNVLEKVTTNVATEASLSPHFLEKKFYAINRNFCL